MEHLNLGQIIITPQNRDAIHIAVAPVVAADKLMPGERVWLEDGKARLGNINSIGVVDPFLPEAVKPGQTFWLWLNPGSITSLRHEWTHPALDGEPVGVAAKALIERTHHPSLLRDLHRSSSGQNTKGPYYRPYVTQQGGENWRNHFSAETFWPAYELITWTSVPADKQDDFFSCSC